jgi:N-acetylglucosaminyldiphosphoundecaprenol N-acetyl-beta-D-mannosaminyltransferase
MLNLDLVEEMNIHSIDKTLLIEMLKKDIDSNISKQHISITNTEAMFIGSKAPEHFKYINEAKFSLCDGVGIKLAAKFHGKNIYRYHGPDVMIDIINAGQEYGWSHYLLGGGEGVGKQLKNILELKYPKAKIIEVYSPPFRELTRQEEKRMLENINTIEPNFLWVSLGLPKQENWIMKYKEQLNVNFCIGIGAAFDFHTNNIKRAPYFYQRFGLEWLYRVIREPRMIKRNISSFTLIFKIIFKGIKNRITSKK